MELNFEQLFGQALGEMLDHAGGCLDIVLSDMGITDEETIKAIKKWYDWEEEPDLPDIVNLNINDLDYKDGDDLDEKISNYLSNEYGFCVNGFLIEEADTVTGDIKVTDIEWDTED